MRILPKVQLWWTLNFLRKLRTSHSPLPTVFPYVFFRDFCTPHPGTGLVGVLGTLSMFEAITEEESAISRHLVYVHNKKEPGDSGCRWGS